MGEHGSIPAEMPCDLHFGSIAIRATRLTFGKAQICVFWTATPADGGKPISDQSQGLVCRSTRILMKSNSLTGYVAGQVSKLRVRARITLHSGASAGRADARRRDAGDVVHLRVAATQQVPARRRAPEGCRLSELQRPMSLSHRIIKPESRQQNVKLFLREPLARFSASRFPSWPSGIFKNQTPSGVPSQHSSWLYWARLLS